MFARTFAIAALTFFATTLAAAPSVGDDAPAISVQNWAMNAPKDFDGSNLKGQVTLVELWGVKCGPCIAQVPHMNKLYSEYTEKGFVLVATERQNHTVQQIQEKLGPMNAVYPVAAGGAGAYTGKGGIPHCYLIGVDGKVIFEGHPGDGKVDELIQSELKKIKFPGLGKIDVVKDLEKAAKNFTAGKLDKARDDANKEIADLKKKAGVEGDAALDESKLDEEAKLVLADANFILGRVNAKLEAMNAAVTAAKEAKEYKDAYEGYLAIIAHFGSSEEAKKAKEAASELMKDKEIKKEIKAQEKLDELINGQKFKGATPERKKNLLEDFAKANKGTKAAEKAEGHISA